MINARLLAGAFGWYLRQERIVKIALGVLIVIISLTVVFAGQAIGDANQNRFAAETATHAAGRTASAVATRLPASTQ